MFKKQIDVFSKKGLTILLFCAIMAKLSERRKPKYAAIAQPVERILGKDEVASSNLASSSIRKPHPIGWGFVMDIFIFAKAER